MAKKLFLVAVGVLLAWGLFKCNESQAKWISTGTRFARGWHLACDYTEMVDYLNAPKCIVLWCEGTVEELQAFVDVWNEPPIVESDTTFYKLESDSWIKIKPPFKWIEGDAI